MFNKRSNEPEYALLNDVECQTNNRYGKNIDTTESAQQLREQSFVINNEEQQQQNPNRYKQHGFYFNADNCIACHACESACSEKNDNPAHLSFRSVGFVEGGTYPAYQRLNISMACNHCDDPVCLKGCPTRAYTKFAEYGAVLQDPDICFGCGYCTWVCPYNAPQLDPVKGQVSKCNMCVDRLEVGLKPACVSACLGNALDFGVIENIPENRTQAKTSIPGFPDPSITHPNVRFQQTRTTHRDMNRVDSTAMKYHRSENNGEHKPELNTALKTKKHWNLKQLLSSHENAHILFTLAAQAVMGAFALLIFLLNADTTWAISLKASGALNVILPVLVLIQSFGLFKLNMHLGKPHRFYRGFYNLKWSPVSREIAGVSLFFTGLLIYTALHFINLKFDVASFMQDASIIAITGILLGGYYMIKLYRIKARPFWNHWHTNASFVASGFTLGASLLLISSLAFGLDLSSQLIAIAIFFGVSLELSAVIAHRNSSKNAHSEAALSYQEQSSHYGYSFILRNCLLVISLLLSVALYLSPVSLSIS
ncbi:MAG: dimethyl sulfoxide reductase anchor subunit, partial [Gammaproteobacteria bacterium]|nr:dimethyl sulfoxide reductase anchor subunit [Gammaproteobacteria bacterium]